MPAETDVGAAAEARVRSGRHSRPYGRWSRIDVLVVVLKEIVEHHAEEEETAMFPRARKLLPASELRRLGAEMAARKRALQRQTGPLGAVAQLFSS